MRRIPRLILLAILALPASCATTDRPGVADAGLVRVVDRRIVMGVETSITTWASSEVEAREATRAAFDRMAGLEQAISDYRPGSESMKAVEVVDEPVEVSTDLAVSLADADRWHRWSGGAFDASIGPSTALWRDARRRGTVPVSRSIEFAATTVGWGKIDLDLDRDPPTVRFRTAAMRLDFGGLGKGLAGDLALQCMRERGLPRTLVDVGGDLVAGDPPPGREGWKVAVRTVAWDDGMTIELRNAAVATSGDVHQFIEVREEEETTRLGHLLDPKTGLPVSIRREATAVVRGGAHPGADADALASVLVVLGVEEATAQLSGRLDARVRVLEARTDTARGDVRDDWQVLVAELVAERTR